jgi:hypothetical protein
MLGLLMQPSLLLLQPQPACHQLPLLLPVGMPMLPACLLDYAQ